MKNLIFRFRKRKKVKPYKVDTSQKGFEYVGIKLSDEQFQDMCNLNLLWANDRKDIPVFNMLVLMKVLGLLPSEMMLITKVMILVMIFMNGSSER